MQQLIDRVKRILLTPSPEWEKISEESWTIQDLFIKHAMILAAIPAVAGIIGHSLIGYSIWGKTIRFGLTDALLWGILYYILSLASAYAVGVIMEALAPKFEIEKDPITSMKIAVFSFTAYWVGGILYIIPRLSVVGSLLGIYSLFLMYVGMKKIRGIPPEKLMAYFVTVVVISIVISMIVGVIAGSVITPTITTPTINFSAG